jgi:adenine-specific DNA-methyltransferase
MANDNKKLEIEKLKAEIELLKKELKKNKKYGLVWEDKPEEMVEMCKEKLPVLKEVKNKEIITDKEKPVNLLIEGDNYHALSVLNYTYAGKVDVIYIDPPYNTGNKDFIFNDHYVDREDAYRHSKWLSFMEKRLKLAKNLLKDDGVIFISIDDNEVAQLKLLMDNPDLFGELNFITKFIWEKTQHFGRQAKNYYSNCEYILTYARKLYSGGLKELLVKSIKSEFEDAPLYNASNRENKLVFPAGKVIFNLRDGVYSKTSDRKYKLLDKVIVKNGKNINDLVLSFKSRWSQETINEEIRKGAKFWVKSEKFAIRVIYGKGRLFRDSPKQIIFTNKNNPFVASDRFGNNVGTTEEGSAELKEIIGEQNVFDYPKPTSLIRYLLSLYFDNNKGEQKKDFIVLDFFAGTGTTGQAVLELNKEDGGNRQFILCTNNENNICTDVCYPRIKKVIGGYENLKGEKVEGLGGNLKYFRTDFVDAEPSDKNKIKLTHQATEMLCIKEGTFEKVIDNERFKIFKNSDHYTGIILDQTAIQEFKKVIKDIKDKFSVYVFSLGDETFDEEFTDIKQKVKLSPIPEAILRVYRRIFK